MIVQPGEKLHIAYRTLHEKSVRRHVVRQVMASEGAVCRLEGYAFIYDSGDNMFTRKKELRTTIVDLAESGYIVNVIPNDVNLADIMYKYESGYGVVATDGKQFRLDINEFGSKA